MKDNCLKKQAQKHRKERSIVQRLTRTGYRKSPELFSILASKLGALCAFARVKSVFVVFVTANLTKSELPLSFK